MPYLQLFQQFAERLRCARSLVVRILLPPAGSTLKSQILDLQLSHDLATDGSGVLYFCAHLFASEFRISFGLLDLHSAFDEEGRTSSFGPPLVTHSNR
jgi:hypothetical protein